MTTRCKRLWLTCDALVVAYSELHAKAIYRAHYGTTRGVTFTKAANRHALTLYTDNDQSQETKTVAATFARNRPIGIYPDS